MIPSDLQNVDKPNAQCTKRWGNGSN